MPQSACERGTSIFILSNLKKRTPEGCPVSGQTSAKYTPLSVVYNVSSRGSTETQMLMYLIYVYPHRLHKTSSSQKWKSIFSFLLGPLSHSLYGKWAFCCPFNAIIGAVQSSALWAEASALHWVSGHTLQSKCCVLPPLSAITPPLLFYHCCAVIQSWRRAGTTEQTNKHTDTGWNHGGIAEPEAHSLPAFSFSVK